MPPISHFRNIPLTWISLLIKEQTHERRFARRLRTSQGILPLTWVPPYEKRDTGMRLFFLTYIIMYVSNVSLRRHYPHQVVGRSVQPPLSRLHRQFPILISNSLSTSIPLPFCDINIIFNIFTVFSPLSIIYLSIF